MRTRPSCFISNKYINYHKLSTSSSPPSPSPPASSIKTTKFQLIKNYSILNYLWIIILAVCSSNCIKLSHGLSSSSSPNESQIKYSTRQVTTRYGSLRGIVARSMSVEVYLGVPYATPPLGALRYMPPITPTQWRGTKFADTYPPDCPQKIDRFNNNYPNLSSNQHRRGYLDESFINNQSEDCLYLNLYVPRPSTAPSPSSSSSSMFSHGSKSELFPTLLLIHGNSYSWGSGNPFDGTALASYGRIIVVSINFRLGILGFLKTGTKGSTQGNYGLMDLIAGLHWLRENIEAFGGDPQRLSILGVGTGAALANFIAVSPMAKELVERVILLGGSALSPWAIQKDPLSIKRKVAEQTGCLGDIETDDIAVCLRLKSIDDLLNVNLETPRFTSGFAPFVDGTVLPLPTSQAAQPTVSTAGVLPLIPGPGSEFLALGNRDILIGLTSCEAWLDLSDDDLKNGLNETRRDRILRTFVRNTYRYHLHEIYSTLRNEYTDWEKGEQSPNVIKDGLLSLLGDGQVAAPLLRLALSHSTSGGRSYFFHFQPTDYISQRGEQISYLLGIPLLKNEPKKFSSSKNYTLDDENITKILVRYFANFIRRGDPNDGNLNIDDFVKKTPFWDSYDSINQLYLEVGKVLEMRSHYRGHKMSLWLNLLPQLHRPGYEINMRHHHLAENQNLYEGAVRPQTIASPLPPPPLSLPSPTEPSMSSKPIDNTECIPNATTNVPLATSPSSASSSSSSSSSSSPYSTKTKGKIQNDIKSQTDSEIIQQSHPKLSPGPNNLLRKFATNHYQNYTTALTVTIAVGIFLLLLNILIFAGIYQQRDRNAATAVAVAAAAAASASVAASSSSSSSNIINYGQDSITKYSKISSFLIDDSTISSSTMTTTTTTTTNTIATHKYNKQNKRNKLADELELQLQEFQCSPPPGGGAKRIPLDLPSYTIKNQLKTSRTPSPCVDIAAQNNQLEPHERGILDEDEDEFVPDPPPPPKAPAPTISSGILRTPGTPGAKKRVQIQEISV